jgi:hypothetical protein
MNNGAKLLVQGHHSQSPQFGMYSDGWGYSSFVSLCISQSKSGTHKQHKLELQLIPYNMSKKD